MGVCSQCRETDSMGWYSQGIVGLGARRRVSDYVWAAEINEHLLLPVLTMDGLFAHPQAQCDGFPGKSGLPGFPDQRRFGAPDFLLQLSDRL